MTVVCDCLVCCLLCGCHSVSDQDCEIGNVNESLQDSQRDDECDVVGDGNNAKNNNNNNNNNTTTTSTTTNNNNNSSSSTNNNKTNNDKEDDNDGNDSQLNDNINDDNVVPVDDNAAVTKDRETETQSRDAPQQVVSTNIPIPYELTASCWQEREEKVTTQ